MIDLINKLGLELEYNPIVPLKVKWDQEYFVKMTQWIRIANNGEHYLSKLTNDPKKFLSHLKWYASKNLDYRSVFIFDVTETETMYGVYPESFILSDIGDEKEAYENLSVEIYSHRTKRQMQGYDVYLEMTKRKMALKPIEIIGLLLK